MPSNTVTSRSSDPKAPSSHSSRSQDSGSPPPGRVGASSFPAKLMLLLQSVEEEHMSHIISWQPHGRSFMVRNQKEFQRQILPRYFRQTKYSSFQRQLNIYEFQRISTGPDKNAYYHLSFQRGKNDLLPLIKRVTVKGTGIRKAPAPEDEPNFYEMAPIAAADPPVSTTVTLEAPSRSLPSLPITGLGLGAHPFTSPTTNLTSLDLLSQLSQIRGLSSQTLPSTTSLYTPLTSLDLGLTLRRAQQMLEEGQLRDAWTRLSALEQLRNQNSSSLLLGGGVPMRSAAELPSLLPPTSNSLLQQFLLKNGTRNFS